MASTHHNLNVHAIWSTKGRVPWITQDVEQRIWEYIGGIARQKRVTPICVGGCDDHIHVLLRLPANLDTSKAIQLIKGSSSKWIHEVFPHLRAFRWQDGFGAFSVSQSGIPAVFKYIKNQRAHHHKKTFQEEYVEFLVKNEIDFDEDHLWD
jgi:putative transposase